MEACHVCRGRPKACAEEMHARKGAARGGGGEALGLTAALEGGLMLGFLLVFGPPSDWARCSWV